jgi:parallel beta-helix repeat protein
VIFSGHVTNSAIKGIISRDNGVNGIMLNARSANNVIEDNTVAHNHGDGIVMSDSASNLVKNNRIMENRVGVFVSPSGSPGNTVVRNRVSNNVLAAQGVELQSSNSTHDNGGVVWIPSRVAVVWELAGGIGLLLWALTWLLRHRIRIH